MWSHSDWHRFLQQVWIKNMHRPGIEPGSPAWQASILPLDHRCSTAFSPYLAQQHALPEIGLKKRGHSRGQRSVERGQANRFWCKSDFGHSNSCSMLIKILPASCASVHHFVCLYEYDVLGSSEHPRHQVGIELYQEWVTNGSTPIVSDPQTCPR